MKEEYTENNTVNTDDEAVEELVLDDVVDLDEDGGEISLETKIKELRKKLKETEKEKSEYLDGWQRSKADAINKQKDFDQRQKELAVYSNQKLLLDLIPVMDSFIMAMSNKVAWEAVDHNWRIGVEYIKSQLETVFRNNDLVIFGKVGDLADPKMYRSIESVETEDDNMDGTVTEVLQYGYILKDRIIREATCKTFVKKD
jgi:molecular chaperone GrpE